MLFEYQTDYQTLRKIKHKFSNDRYKGNFSRNKKPENFSSHYVIHWYYLNITV